MTSSFAGSAIEDLIKRADSMTPDFSSKGPQVRSDMGMFDAPAMVGKFFALKKQLEIEESDIDPDDEEAIKNNRSDQSLCHHMAARELRMAIGLHPCRKDMVVRNTGVVVIMRRTVPAALSPDALADRRPHRSSHFQ